MGVVIHPSGAVPDHRLTHIEGLQDILVPPLDALVNAGRVVVKDRAGGLDDAVHLTQAFLLPGDVLVVGPVVAVAVVAWPATTSAAAPQVIGWRRHHQVHTLIRQLREQIQTVAVVDPVQPTGWPRRRRVGFGLR